MTLLYLNFEVWGVTDWAFSISGNNCSYTVVLFHFPCFFAQLSSPPIRYHKMSKHRNVSFPCNQCDHITNMPASLRYHTRAKHYYILCICVLWVYLWIYCVRWPWWLQCFSNPAKCSPPLLLIQTIICLLFRSNWNIPPPYIEIF